MHTRIRATLGRARTSILLIVGSLLLVPAAAQQDAGLPSYDVEIVVFRHLSSDATSEEWGLESSSGVPAAIPEEDAVPFDPGAQSPNPTTRFPALPPSSYELSAIEEALRRSRGYQVLAHFGWTQPGYARDAAPFISIDELVPSASALSGQIALSRGRYLHLTVDLVYAPQEGSETAERYVLRHSRRMRSNERHYIDHPKFGVIALVKPHSG